MSERERMRTPTGPAFAEALTYSFGDPERDLYGLVRVGVAADRRGSLLAVLFAGGRPVGVNAEGALDVPAEATWDDFAVDGARTTIEAPLERWTLRWDGGGAAADLVFEAASAPADLAVGDMEGYDQICRVTGTVTVDGTAVAVSGLGQRGHAWGAPDWSRLELTRTVAAWLDDGSTGVVVSAARPAGATAHADETVAAAVVEAGEPVAVDDPRLSTTYDGEGRQRRAGLELWICDEDDYPLRASGEAICGSTLDLGSLRLDLAFLRWRADGRTGIGRYDIVRRAPS